MRNVTLAAVSFLAVLAPTIAGAMTPSEVNEATTEVKVLLANAGKSCDQRYGRTKARDACEAQAVNRWYSDFRSAHPDIDR